MTRPNAYLAGLGAVMVFICGALYHDAARKRVPQNEIRETQPAQSIDTPPESFLQGVKDDKARSHKWEAFAIKCKAAHPFCAYCGNAEKLQAHHIHAFELMTPEQRGTAAPGGELDPDNIIILCEVQPSDHHLRIGHLGNFKNSDPNVVEVCKKHEADLRVAGEWPR